MRKYALIVRVSGTTGGKYYNDYRDGSVLLFDDEKKAENFALRVEEESSKTVWIEVVEYNPNLKLDNLIDPEFVETLGKRMSKE